MVFQASITWGAPFSGADWPTGWESGQLDRSQEPGSWAEQQCTMLLPAVTWGSDGCIRPLHPWDLLQEARFQLPAHSPSASQLQSKHKSPVGTFKTLKMNSICNRAGPPGAFVVGGGGCFGGPAFPHILFFSSSLKFLDNSILCKCPKLFCRYELPQDHHQKENVNYLMIWSTHPQASRSLRTDRLTPVKLPAISPSQSGGCAQADPRHCKPPPSPGLCMRPFRPKPFGELRVF